MRGKSFLCAVALVLAARCCAADTAVTGFIGNATFFNAQAATGSCGYPPESAFPAVAISPNSSLALQTSPLDGCGTCIEIKRLCTDTAAPGCQVASLTAQVVSTCASCSTNSLNLDKAAFQRLGGDLSAGTMAVTFRAIECIPPAGSNISVIVSDYRASEGGWLRLTLTNVAGTTGIASVELRQTPLATGRLDIVSSAWKRLTNVHGAAWDLAGIPAPPLDIRITDGAHRQVLARRVIARSGAVGAFQTNVQFPPLNSSAGIAATVAAELAQPDASALTVGTLGAAPTTSIAAEPAGLPAELTDNPMPDVAGSNGTDVSTQQPAADEEADAEALALALPPTDAIASQQLSSSRPCNASIVSVLEGLPETFSIMVTLIRTAGIEDALADPSTPLTLFAPSNSAWLRAVKQLPIVRYDQDTLKNVLLQHILVGRKDSVDLSSQQLMRHDTLGGGYLSVRMSSKGQLLVVSQASAGTTVKGRIDLPACSSVVHACSSVLMPDLTTSRRRRH